MQDFNKISKFFDEEKSLNVIGVPSEKTYGWYLKEISTRASQRQIRIYLNEFAFPSNMQVITAIQNSVPHMNLGNLAGEEIILSQNVLLNKRISAAIADILQKAIYRESRQQDKEFLFIKHVVWLYERMAEHNFATDARLIYFGRLNDDYLLHINLLNAIGYHVLYLCPTHEHLIPTATEEIKFTKQFNNFNFAEIMAQGEKPQNNVVETSAKRATQEIEEMLYDGDLVIKPWRYRTGTVQHLHLNAVLEDIWTFWRQDARFREGFQIVDNTVYVPSFALELHGVYSESEKTSEFLKLLTTSELTQVEGTVDFLQPTYADNEMYTLAFAMGQHGLSFAKLSENKLYKLNTSSMDVQKFIFNKLNEFYQEHKSLNQITLLRLIANVVTMPIRYLKLIESFDFPFKVPKIVLYIPNRCQLPNDNYLFLKFMNSLGFDILLLSPDGTEVCHELPDLIVGEFKNNLSLEEAIKPAEKKSFWRKLFE